MIIKRIWQFIKGLCEHDGGEVYDRLFSAVFCGGPIITPDPIAHLRVGDGFR